MKIGIIGYGVVGRAISNTLCKKYEIVKIQEEVELPVAMHVGAGPEIIRAAKAEIVDCLNSVAVSSCSKRPRRRPWRWGSAAGTVRAVI